MIRVRAVLNYGDHNGFFTCCFRSHHELIFWLENTPNLVSHEVIL